MHALIAEIVTGTRLLPARYYSNRHVLTPCVFHPVSEGLRNQRAGSAGRCLTSRLSLDLQRSSANLAILTIKNDLNQTEITFITQTSGKS